MNDSVGDRSTTSKLRQCGDAGFPQCHVASDQGNITIYTFADDYTVTNTQVVSTIAGLSNKPFSVSRSILPILRAPLSFMSFTLAFTLRETGHLAVRPLTTGISVLAGPVFATAQPLITMLPVSNHDHAINGMAFDNLGDLFIANGGNTNAGIPSTGLGTSPDRHFRARSSRRSSPSRASTAH